MILVDAGPRVALFDPRDARHGRRRETLRSFREPLSTTVPVLWFMDGDHLHRDFGVELLG